MAEPTSESALIRTVASFCEWELDLGDESGPLNRTGVGIFRAIADRLEGLEKPRPDFKSDPAPLEKHPEHQHEGWQVQDGYCRACGAKVDENLQTVQTVQPESMRRVVDVDDDDTLAEPISGLPVLLTGCPKAIGKPRWCECHGWGGQVLTPAGRQIAEVFRHIRLHTAEELR